MAEEVFIPRPAAAHPGTDGEHLSEIIAVDLSHEVRAEAKPASSKLPSTSAGPAGGEPSAPAASAAVSDALEKDADFSSGSKSLSPEYEVAACEPDYDGDLDEVDWEPAFKLGAGDAVGTFKVRFPDGQVHSSILARFLRPIAAAVPAPVKEVSEASQPAVEWSCENVPVPARKSLANRASPRRVTQQIKESSWSWGRSGRSRKTVDRLAEHSIAASETTTDPRKFYLKAGAMCRFYDDLYDHYRICTLVRLSSHQVVRQGEPPKVVVTFADDDENDEYEVSSTSLKMAFQAGDRVMVSLSLIDGDRDYVGVVSSLESISKYRVWFDDDASTLVCSSSRMRHVSIIEFPLLETNTVPMKIRLLAESTHDTRCCHCLTQISKTDSTALKCSTCTYSCHEKCLDQDDPASALTWPVRTDVAWQCSACCLDPALKVGLIVPATSPGACAPRVAVSGNTLLKIRKTKVKPLKHAMSRMKNREHLVGLKRYLLRHGILIDERLWKCNLNGDRTREAPNIFVDSLKGMHWIGHSAVLNAIESGILPGYKRVMPVVWPKAKGLEEGGRNGGLEKAPLPSQAQPAVPQGSHKRNCITNQVNPDPSRMPVGRTALTKKKIKKKTKKKTKKETRFFSKKRKRVVVSSSDDEGYSVEEVPLLPSSLPSSSSLSSAGSRDEGASKARASAIHPRWRTRILTKPVPRDAICFLCGSAVRKELYYWQAGINGAMAHFDGRKKRAKNLIPNFDESFQYCSASANHSKQVFCHLRCRVCHKCGEPFRRSISSRKIMSKSKEGLVCRGCSENSSCKIRIERERQRPQQNKSTGKKPAQKAQRNTERKKPASPQISERNPKRMRHGSSAAHASSATNRDNDVENDDDNDEDNGEELLCLEYPGEDRNAQIGFKGVTEIIDANFGTSFEAKVGHQLLGVFRTAEEAARARDMSLVVRAFRKRKAGDKSNDPARANGLNFPKSVIASLCCDSCSRSFDCLGGIFGLIQHQDEGICKKIFAATEEYAEANDSAERAAAVRDLNVSFKLPQSRIEEGWILNEDPAERVRLRRFFEVANSGDGSSLGTAVAVLLHPQDGFFVLMLHDDGDMEDLNREEFDQAKRDYYEETGWLNPLDPTTMEHKTMQDSMSLGQAAVEIRAKFGIKDADLTAEMLLRWNKFINGEKMIRNARLKGGTTIWFRNPEPGKEPVIRSFALNNYGKKAVTRMDTRDKLVPPDAVCFFCDGGKRENLHFFQARRFHARRFFNASELIPAERPGMTKLDSVYAHDTCRACVSCGERFVYDKSTPAQRNRKVQAKSPNGKGFVCLGCSLQLNY